MAQKPRQPDAWHESLQRGYEPGDMRLRWFTVAVIGFIVAGVAMHVALWFVLKGLATDVRKTDQPRSVLTQNPPRLEGPPLQPTQSHDQLPQEDLQQMRTREDEVFANLGWKVDRERHRVEIPADVVHAVATRMKAKPATTQAGGGA